MVWGIETGYTIGEFPLRTALQSSETNGTTVFDWAIQHPPLSARYRFEWKFRGPQQTGCITGAALEEGLRSPHRRSQALALWDQLRQSADRLQEIYPFSKGVGLAAPQIGLSRAKHACERGLARLVLHELDHLRGTLARGLARPGARLVPIAETEVQVTSGGTDSRITEPDHLIVGAR